MKETTIEITKAELLDSLKKRFEANIIRHKDIKWVDVLERIENNVNCIKALTYMTVTMGEPDVAIYDAKSDTYTFMDFSIESPNRRSLCYDDKALKSRKKYPPVDSVMTVAKNQGIEVLDEKEYYFLQQFGPFDTKTSSWIKTPDVQRSLGGALFCDAKYDRVFTYHNGADSYYASRGFRAKLVI